jgi:hypothetical protein
MGTDVAAGQEYYYAILYGDLYRSVDGYIWKSMKVSASRVTAKSGRDGKDYVAIVTSGGYIKVYHENSMGEGTWVTLSKNTVDNKVIAYFQDVSISGDGALWGLGNNDKRMFFAGGGEWPGASTLWSTWYTQKAQAIAFAPITDPTNGVTKSSPLIINEHGQVWHWDWYHNKWVYLNANNVADICGTAIRGFFGGAGNIWLNSNSGALNYESEFEAPYRYWTAWSATKVARVGCSDTSKLLVVNTINGAGEVWVKK